MNIVLIILDCLRLDKSEEIYEVLKKYGFYKYESISAAPWTIPSHVSMLTGLYPSEHGAHETKERKVGKIDVRIKDNLISDLKKKGYTSYLFTANAFLTERFGFTDFDHIYFNGNIPDRIYLKPDELKILTEETLVKNPKDVLITLLKKGNVKLLTKGIAVYLYRKFSEKIGGWPVEKGVSKITEKIKKTELEEPFVLMVNLMELHEPYRARNNIKAEYEYQLSYLKSKFSKFMETLNDKGVLKNSAVIVTSDHGQLLGENGKTGHGIYLEDALIRVPLLTNFEIDEHEGYISHVNLRRFLTALANDKKKDSVLFSKAVFSEAFGSYSAKIVVSPEYERHRIAVFYKGCKGIYDAEARKFKYVSTKEEEVKKELEELIKKFISRTKRRAFELKLKSKVTKLKGKI